MTRHAAILAALLLLAGCAPQDGRQTTDGGPRTQASVELEVPRAPQNPAPAPEPARSPQISEQPAGKVVEIGDSPEGLVADPRSGLVAAGMRDPDRLALIESKSGNVVSEVDLPESPRHLGLAAPGGPVLVPAERSNELALVSLPEGEVVRSVPVGRFPHDAAATPNGRIFVINELGHTASVIKDGRVVGTVDTPLQPGGVAATASGKVGVIGVRGLALELYDASTLKTLGRVGAGEGPTHVVSGPRDRLYVADTRGDAVLVYDTEPRLEQVARLPVPNGAPYGLSVDPERELLWVTLTAENRLIQYDISGEEPHRIGQYPTVAQPNSVAADPASGRVFVAGTEEGELQILTPSDYTPPSTR